MNTQNKLHTALITGSTSGIGLELTRMLLVEGWQVIGLNRSLFPAEQGDIQNALRSGQLRLVQANLTNYESLRIALDQIKSETDSIDALFNNAGGSASELRYSDQGHEMHFELQTVVPYIIYKELYGLLLKGQLKTVVNTSTSAFNMLKRFDLNILERPTEFKKLFGPYATSKLGLSLWTHEAAADAAKTDGIRLLSVDPGGNNTLRGNKKSGLPFYIKPIMKLFFPHPSHGASLLYNGGFSSTRHEPGTFLIKNKAKSLRFKEHGAAVLNRVHEIYEQEFLHTVPVGSGHQKSN
ncbi:SDR family NAD(P)-dependent oxidoreductase [Paenibacillus xylanilyticus]|uniref:SDR family NAD(P)-dependent oxidoreductase n=1 Tax=Paenibacillus xylanilyticus TaxID=248903 RepID=A0A7Y6C402_9BACL|nr:SDR family NAD(P)-dependent oxidoreductase [Paenibacillus xylanilyticus]NUU80172.1 SDR family NAD(P)-dependent oxidoreductase [Paenibacillus xylanilyticus]